MVRFWSRRAARQSCRRTTTGSRCSLRLEPLEARTLLTFGPPINTPVGQGPENIALADFNGDGILDMAVTNKAGNSVSILLGNGDGIFTPSWEYRMPGGPTTILAGDVNGDGVIDLLVSSPGSNAIMLMVGNGDGTFQDPQVAATCTGGCGAGKVNFQEFTIMRFAVTNRGDPTRPGFVEIWDGNGDGTFHSSGQYPVQGANPVALTFADLNGDGNPDIVTANMDTNSVSTLFGTDDGRFQTGPSYRVGIAPMSVAVGDVDGDGFPDIVTANFGTSDNDSSVSVLHNNGDGTFAQARQIVIRIKLWDVTIIITINLAPGQTQQTIAATGYTDGQVHTFAQDDSGGFSETGHFPVGAGPATLAVGDINGDGLNDLAVANSLDNSVSVLLQTGAGPVPGSRGNTPGGQVLATALTSARPSVGFVSSTTQATPAAAVRPADVDRVFATTSENDARLTPASPRTTLLRTEHARWEDFFIGDTAGLLSL